MSPIQKAVSFDQVSIQFETHGSGEVALLFVHGWLGNRRWWDQQRVEFSSKHQVVQIDLGGHGESQSRVVPSVKAYAEDIRAVVNELGLKKVILVGHSMSGSNVVEAYHLVKEKVCGIILVDTLLNLDQMPSLEEAKPFFEAMQKDYKGTIQTLFKQFVFSPASPELVVNRVVQEVCAADPEAAIAKLTPFYSTDIREACCGVQVPVRAINCQLFQTNAEGNRKYFKNYDYQTIAGVGHYPMLENPQAFNQAMHRAIEGILN